MYTVSYSKNRFFGFTGFAFFRGQGIKRMA